MARNLKESIGIPGDSSDKSSSIDDIKGSGSAPLDFDEICKYMKLIEQDKMKAKENYGVLCEHHRRKVKINVLQMVAILSVFVEKKSAENARDNFLSTLLKITRTNATEIFGIVQVLQDSVPFLNSEKQRNISLDEIKEWSQYLLVSSVLFKKLIAILNTFKCKEKFTVSLCWKYFLIIQELFDAKDDIVNSARLLLTTVAFLVAEQGVMGNPRLRSSGMWKNLEAMGVSLGGPSMKQISLSNLLCKVFDQQYRLIKDEYVQGSIIECNDDTVATSKEEVPTAAYLQVYTNASNVQKSDTWLGRVFPVCLLDIANVDTLAQIGNCEEDVQRSNASQDLPSSRTHRRGKKRLCMNNISKGQDRGTSIYSKTGSFGWLWANTASPHHSCRATSLRYNAEIGHLEHSENRMNSDSMENLNWAANIALTDRTQALNEFTEALGYLVDKWACTFDEKQTSTQREEKIRLWGNCVAEEINFLSKRVCDYYHIRADAARDFRRPSAVSILNRNTDSSNARSSAQLTVKQSAAKMVLDTTIKLYYVLLPVVVYEGHEVHEERNKLPDLLQDRKFLCSMFCLCFDALSYAYCVHLHALGELRDIFDIDCFDLWKAAEPVQHVGFFIPVTVRRHIAWVEEQLMEQYVLHYSKPRVFQPLEEYIREHRIREISTREDILDQFSDICRSIPASLGLFLKKISRMAAGRIEFLVDALNLPSRVPEDHPHSSALKHLDTGSVVWTVFMYCISTPQVFCDFLNIDFTDQNEPPQRGIDHLVLCCVYGTCKLLHFSIAFADVVKAYERFCGTGAQASIYNLTLKIKTADGGERLSHGENIISLYNNEFLGLTRSFLHTFKERLVDAFERGGVSSLVLRLPRTPLDSIPAELGGQSTRKQLMRRGPDNLLVARIEDKSAQEHQDFHSQIDHHMNSDESGTAMDSDFNSGLLALSSAAENALMMNPSSKRPREDDEQAQRARYYCKSVRDSPVSVEDETSMENINPSNFHTTVKKIDGGLKFSFGDNPAINSSALKKINARVN